MEINKELPLYETFFIIRPEHGGKVKELIEKFKNIIEGLGASVTHVEEWGVRELAYPIQKLRRGHYNLIHYRATASTVDELERQMKLSEEVMRSISVRIDEVEEATEPPEPKGDPRGASEESTGDPTKAK
jgi:small subunit ribosomal protein S6